jgi:deazaflavin-dependent oxidoreductase (nitroreductase family)
VSASGYERRKTVRLTTRGRRSGQPRTVTIWFVPLGAHRIAVQHVSSSTAQWYRNLSADAAVTLDFGTGPIAARATPITDAEAIRRVLTAVRQRYWSAWLIQLLARGRPAVAAEIEW